MKNPLPKPFIRGKDLLDLGFPARSILGQTLKKCYYLQLEKALLSREEALNWVKKEKTQLLFPSPKRGDIL